ncbi:MAG: phosphoglycerate dehydrogenase [Actinomycetales bacterium]
MSVHTPDGKPVVLISEKLSPATVDALGGDVQVRHVDGTDRAALLAEIADASALLVRSATQVDAELLAAAPKLQVVARAGVGLDNVDVPAATTAGVMVVNAPTSNIRSAAEHACALILAAARRVAPASQTLKAGTWERNRFTGTELAGKTLGVVGLGRIGVLVAQRMAAFDMTVMAYDPYVSASRAAQLGVHLTGLDELMAASDVVTVHLPKTPETLGLIDERLLAAAKPGLVLVNASRGGIVDEDALAGALTEGRVSAAGLDVFAAEPCTESPLFGFDQVVVTPHLGASTHEAQEQAGIAVARSVRLALAGDLVPDAVNVAGGTIDEVVRPGLPLTEKLGRLLTALCDAAITHLDVEVSGEIAALDVSVLQLAALKGLLIDQMAEPVTYVNAPHLAQARGIEVRLVTDPDNVRFRNSIKLTAVLEDGQVVSVEGTLTGPQQVAKLVGVYGHPLEVEFADRLLVMRYSDRPGVIGLLGGMLGQSGVNIASMVVGRDDAGGHAVSVLTLDGQVKPALVEALRTAIDADTVIYADLAEG